jgi:ribosomal protein L18E
VKAHVNGVPTTINQNFAIRLQLPKDLYIYIRIYKIQNYGRKNATN